MLMGEVNNQKSQKTRELEVLEDVLAFCRNSGGYKKKQALKLGGTVDSKHERPDLTIVRDDCKTIGLEHFRVDHHVGKGKKAESRTAKLDGLLAKERKKLGHACGDEIDEETLHEFAYIVANGCAQHMQNHNNACCDDLACSLDKRLFDEKAGHAWKLSSYRDSLTVRYGADSAIELGYLIELHSDFRGLFLTDNRGTKCLKAGECPLFEEIYDLLERASKDVDWILIAFCPSLGNALVDAAIIDCRNGFFKTSCARQGLLRTAYLGLGKDAPYRRQSKPGDASVALVDDEYQVTIDNEADSLDPVAVWNTAIEGSASALNLERQGLPFTATISVQMVYETIRHEGKRVPGVITPRTVLQLLGTEPFEGHMARMRDFGERYDISRNANQKYDGIQIDVI